jgi:hypothetical protein
MIPSIGATLFGAIALKNLDVGVGNRAVHLPSPTLHVELWRVSSERASDPLNWQLNSGTRFSTTKMRRNFRTGRPDGFLLTLRNYRRSRIGGDWQ